jgi:hypothetical protein
MEIAAMRCDQYYGLNNWAKALVQKTQQVREVGERKFNDGATESFDRLVEITVAKIESIGKIEGAFDPIVSDLHRYTMPNGDVFEEYIQASPWSSGPCYFIALKHPDGSVVKQSLWRRESINRA